MLPLSPSGMFDYDFEIDLKLNKKPRAVSISQAISERLIEKEAWRAGYTLDGQPCPESTGYKLWPTGHCTDLNPPRSPGPAGTCHLGSIALVGVCQQAARDKHGLQTSATASLDLPPPAHSCRIFPLSPPTPIPKQKQQMTKNSALVKDQV
ncbi:hypothetical protein QTO34_018759 [Cnephaeus nilssonii]|uniref:Uncharacterized protein n=1 Tax=Cnephaeus nilssonii TaxID=3371016 RepID=A0AA40HZD9_CNENI|nr:hypothetical protein QTO34_018759 [Eptesicus nilssonii]